MTGSK